MNKITEIFKLPLYFIQIFSQTKSFKNNPIIGNKFLNLIGLHVTRVIISHFIFKFRQFFLIKKISKKERIKFNEQGFLVIENVLSESEFKALKNEVINHDGNSREMTQGDTKTIRAFMHDEELRSLPFIRSFTNKPEIINRLKFTSAKNETPRFYIEKICNHVDNNKRADPQKNAHIDTFHPTMKSWFYLEDVSDKNGPFCYVVGSNKLTFKRLKWEYKKSVNAKNIKDGYSEKGSFRFSKEDLEEIDCKVTEKFQVKKNSLLIANTFGVHFRGEAKKSKATRLSIWSSSRVNPFNPWPGLGTQLESKIRNKGYLKFYEYEEKKALKQGKKPSWENVKRKNFT